MSLALLSLGSNIEPEKYLSLAANDLRQQFPTVAFSPVYRYAAVGFEGPDFFNAAAMVETALSPQKLNDWLHALEDTHGRRRDVPRFSSRTLDIDLVLYDQVVMEGEGNLKLPRSDLKHAFVLEPLAILAPTFIEPLSGKTLLSLWQGHADYSSPARMEALVL